MRQHRRSQPRRTGVIESRAQLANSERALTQIGARSAGIIDRSKTTERPRHATLGEREMPLSCASSPYRQSKIRFRPNQSAPFDAHLAVGKASRVVNHAATVQDSPRRNYSKTGSGSESLLLILVAVRARTMRRRSSSSSSSRSVCALPHAAVAGGAGRQGRKRQSGFVRLERSDKSAVGDGPSPKLTKTQQRLDRCGRRRSDARRTRHTGRELGSNYRPAAPSAAPSDLRSQLIARLDPPVHPKPVSSTLVQR